MLPITVQAEFDQRITAYSWGNSNPAYVDLTNRTISMSIERGRTDPSRPYNAGGCTIVVRNLDAHIDPNNTLGPYYEQIAVGRRIRITTNYNTANQATIFLGFINDITLSYDLSGQATATITASDGLSILAQEQIPAGTTFAAEDTYTRMVNVLDLSAVNYPFSVASNTGNSICAAGSASGNVLQYLAQVAQTEQGAIYISRTGQLVFANRYDILSAPVQTFTDDGGVGINYADVERLVTSVALYNRLAANRTGGSDVVRDSGTSSNLFGIRFLDLGEVFFQTDAEVTDMLDFALVRYSDANPRMSKVSTIMNTKSTTVIRDLSELDLTKSVTVEFTPPGMSQIVVPCTIEYIRHEYTYGSTWRATFGFVPRDTSNYLVLDDLTLGRLDFNALAF